MRKIQIGVALAVGCVVVAVLWVGCGSGASQSTQESPIPVNATAGSPVTDGATLVQTRCSVCHSTDRVTRATKSRVQWDQTVTRMIKRGAQLTDTEKQALIDYLATHYGS